MYRHISKGAWTFSMQDHGWQVSDCTAEGLKVIPQLYQNKLPKLQILEVCFKAESYIPKHSLFQVAILFSQMSPDLVGEKMETPRFYDAVNVILSLQVRSQPFKFYF